MEPFVNARERETVAKNPEPADYKQCCFPSRSLSFRCVVDTQAWLVEECTEVFRSAFVCPDKCLLLTSIS